MNIRAGMCGSQLARRLIQTTQSRVPFFENARRRLRGEHTAPAEPPSTRMISGSRAPPRTIGPNLVFSSLTGLRKREFLVEGARGESKGSLNRIVEKPGAAIGA
jgi:hypothetical protein